MRRFGSRFLVACLAVTLINVAVAQSSYRGRLSVVPIDFRSLEQTTGSGSIDAGLDGNRLAVSARFEGLSGNATTAALHMGAVPGARGPMIYELSVSPSQSGAASGTLELNRREIEALRSGRIYLQIHSEAAPDGNLWGWLIRQGPQQNDAR